MPVVILGAINSHNLKLRSDGSIFLDEASQLSVRHVLSVNAGHHVTIHGKIRSKIIDLFAKSFFLAASGQIETSERNHIQSRQKILLSGLLSSGRDNVLTVKDGDIYIGQTALVKSGSCTSVDATYFFQAGKLDTTCLRILVKDFEQAPSAELKAKDSEINAQSASLSGQTTSESAKITARDMKLHGVLSASELQIKTETLRTSLASLVRGDDLHIAALETNVYGLINSRNLVLDSKSRLVLHDGAKITATGKARLKTEGTAELTGEIRARVIDIFAADFKLLKSAKLSAEELAKIHGRLQVEIDGLLSSDGKIIVSSEGTVEFTESSQVKAKESLSIKAKKFLSRGKVSAAQIQIDVEELTTFANSRLDARDIDIKTISGQIAGVLSSERLTITASGKLQILSGADLQAQERTSIKAVHLEVSGDVRSKVIEILAQNIDLLEDAKLTADEQLLVKADLQIKVKGLLSSKGGLHVEGDRVYFSESSLIHAGTLAHIKAKHLEAGGALEAPQLKVVADTLKTASTNLIKGSTLNFEVLEADLYGVINSKSLQLDVKKRLVLRDSARISTEEQATIRSASVELSGEVRAKIISLFANDLMLLKSGKLTAEQTAMIQAGLKAKLDGLVESKGNLVLVAGELTLSQSGKIDAQAVQVKIDTFFSEGTVAGRDSLILDVDKSFKNSGSLRGGRVHLEAKEAYANSGKISAQEDLYIKVAAAVTAQQLGKTSAGTWTTLDGEFQSDDVLTLLGGNSGQVDTKKLRVITSKPVTINRHVSSSFDNDIHAPSLTLEKDQTFKNNGDLSLNLGTLQAQAGSSLQAEGSVDIEAQGDVVQESEREEQGQIKRSKISSGGSTRIRAKGKYINQGSHLLAKETVVIKTEGGVVIVPLIWVETREEEENGWFIKKTTVIHEEKQQKAKIGGAKTIIETPVESEVRNVEWVGSKDFNPHVKETAYDLRIEEKSYKSFTGVGKVVITAVSAATLVAASSFGPGGTVVASVALNYAQSQMLSQKFQLNVALKMAAINVAAASVGAAAGESVGATFSGTTGAFLGGATQGVVSYTAQSCMHKDCKSFDRDEFAYAGLAGGVTGAAMAGEQGTFLEGAGKSAGASVVTDATFQTLQGNKKLDWERLGEDSLHAGVGYASGRATQEALDGASKVPSQSVKMENKVPETSAMKEETLAATEMAQPKEVSGPEEKPKAIQTDKAKPTETLATEPKKVKKKIPAEEKRQGKTTLAERKPVEKVITIKKPTEASKTVMYSNCCFYLLLR